jgi:hypothetical protein
MAYEELAHAEKIALFKRKFLLVLAKPFKYKRVFAF